MLNIGPPELLLVLVIALIVVGPQKLPELARTIGRGLSEFRKVQDEVKDMVKLDLNMDPVASPTPSVKNPPPTPHRTPRPANPTDDAHPAEPAGRRDAPIAESASQETEGEGAEPGAAADPTTPADAPGSAE